MNESVLLWRMPRIVDKSNIMLLCRRLWLNEPVDD